MKRKKQSQDINESAVKKYERIIGDEWSKAVESIIAIGKHLNKAKRELGTKGYTVLLNRLKMTQETARRLGNIAKCGHFRGKRVQKLLPPHYSTLHEITSLNEKQFKKLKESGILRTTMERKELLPFKTDSNEKTKKPKVGKAKNEIADSIHVSKKTDEVSTKALIDLHFLLNLFSKVSEHTAQDAIEINTAQKYLSLSQKGKVSNKVYHRIINYALKVENHRRHKQGKKNLSEFQLFLSILGLNPDALGDNPFSLMERLVLSYARRQGISCITEDDLCWFADDSDKETELFDEFLEEVEEQVEQLISIDIQEQDIEIAKSDGVVITP